MLSQSNIAREMQYLSILFSLLTFRKSYDIPGKDINKKLGSKFLAALFVRFGYYWNEAPTMSRSSAVMAA